jgi:hypothetical protein
MSYEEKCGDSSGKEFERNILLKVLFLEFILFIPQYYLTKLFNTAETPQVLQCAVIALF